jgi:nucleoid-associated protein YgaU
MTGQTSARIGLPVMLAFVVAFGVILATNSGRYEVSPPTRAVEAGFRRVAPIDPEYEVAYGNASAHDFGTTSHARQVDSTAEEASPDRNGVSPAKHGRRRTVEDSDTRTADAHRVGSPKRETMRRPLQKEVTDRADAPQKAGSPAKKAEKGKRPADSSKRKATASAPSSKSQRRPSPAKQKTGTQESATPKPAVPTPRPPKRKRTMDELDVLKKELDKAVRTVNRVPTIPDPAPEQPAAVIPATNQYKVQPRDNLIKICKRVYGTSDRKVVQALYEANRDRLKNRNLVKVGQQLRLPAYPATRVERTRSIVPAEQFVGKTGSSQALIKLPDPVPQPKPPATERKSPSGSTADKKTQGKAKARAKSGAGTKGKTRYRLYRVKRNESLSKIAAKTLGNGRRWRELWKLNKGRLRRPNHLPAGICIRVPLASPASESPGLLRIEEHLLWESI